MVAQLGGSLLARVLVDHAIMVTSTYGDGERPCVGLLTYGDLTPILSATQAAVMIWR